MRISDWMSAVCSSDLQRVHDGAGERLIAEHRGVVLQRRVPGNEICLEERAAALQRGHDGPVEGKHGVEEDRCNEQGKAQARRDAQGRKPPPAHDAALRSPRSTRPTVISNAVTSATTKKRQVAAAEPKPTF